ncbi:A24 family peptidase [Vibrio astriarenae]|uniref:A24 family peptidase n=1 Tax=Vibrio agarivorans TaxID=153622 RepID=UPI0035A2360C
MFTLLVFVTLLWISFRDIQSRVISNKSIVALFFMILILCYFDARFVFFPLSFVLTLFLGLLIYCIGGWGAGDVKLSSVLAILVPVNNLTEAFYATVFIGGVLSILCLIKKAIYKGSLSNGVPYGVAISGGFFLTIFLPIFKVC